jgi:hypothetical protein
MKNVTNLRVVRIAKEQFALVWEEDGEHRSALIEKHVAEVLVLSDNGIPLDCSDYNSLS